MSLVDEAVTLASAALKAPAAPAWVDVRKSFVAENFIGDAGACPTGLVHRFRVEAGEMKQITGGFRQTTYEQFAVVIVCLESELDQRRIELSAALLAKQPTGYVHLITYAGGSIVELNATTCAWREVFQIQVDRRYP